MPILVQAIFLISLLFIATAPHNVAALTPRSPIYIDGNADFVSANGVVGGSGTPADPYIIEGWEINATSAHGIEIRHTNDDFIIRNVHLHSGGSSYYGIRLWDVANGRLENVTAEANQGGVRVIDSRNLTLRNIDAYAGEEGISSSSTNNLTIMSSRLWDNGFGLQLLSTTDVSILDTQVTQNAMHGVDIALYSGDVTLRNVSATANGGYGFDLASVDNVTLSNSTVTGNREGVNLHANVRDVLISDSNISSNTDHGVVISYASRVTLRNNSLSHNGVYLRGVYLSELNTHDITPDNRVNGKPLAYYRNCDGVSLDGQEIGQLIAVNCTNVQATNLVLEDTDVGIQLAYVDQALLAGNEIHDNLWEGIRVQSSTNVTLRDNHVYRNGYDGVSIATSAFVTMEGNDVADNAYNGVHLTDAGFVTMANNTLTTDGLVIWGGSVGAFNTHEIPPNNLVNGKPLYYHRDCGDQQIDSLAAGQLILANCTNVLVTNLSISGTDLAIQLGFVENGTVAGNRLVGNGGALSVHLSENTTIFGNNISNNVAGIFLYYATNATIRNNLVAVHAEQGVLLYSAQGVRTFHNNLVGNVDQGVDWGLNNVWDDGYPSGGNYWSDYAGSDNCSGPAQDVCPDPDGLGDQPYLVAGGSADAFPLMEPAPFAEPDVAAYTVPVASFTASPPSGEAPVTVTFDASASSDAEDPTEVLEVRWDWEGDLSWDTGWSTEKVAQHVYMRAGTITVRLQVKDSDGMVATASKQVVVSPDTTAPLIAHTPPSEMEVNQALKITATVTDASGIHEVQLHFRGVGASAFAALELERVEGDLYAAEIPAQGAAGFLEYHIVTVDVAGNEARDPLDGEYTVRVGGAGLFLPLELPWLVALLAATTGSLPVAYLLIRRRKHRSESTVPEEPPSETEPSLPTQSEDDR